MNRTKTLTKLARDLNRETQGRADFSLPVAFYLTDENRRPDPFETIESLPAGCGVIFRHYTYPDRAALATEVAQCCAREQLPLLIGGDAPLALRLRADGVHLPQSKGHEIAKWKRHGLLVSSATHDVSSLWRAQTLGADLAFLSPIFATKSHPDQTGLGVIRAAQMARTVTCPVYALGGITTTTIRRLRGSGFSGVGAIGGFDPCQTIPSI